MTTELNSENTQFIDRKQHDEIISEIESFGAVEKLADPSLILNKYFSLLKLRDQAFPLLLRNGTPLMLERAPTHLYLLPEFPPLGEHVRWMLVQYPSVRNHLPFVELLQWKFPPDGKAEILTFGKTHIVETDSDKIYADFTQRALCIRSTIDDEELTLTLQFEHGQLKINAFSDSGIDSLHWTERPPLHRGRRMERASFGAKPALLWVGENCSIDNWYRDNLYDNQDGLDKLSETVGRVCGMDAAQDNPKLIYFGDSSSRIHRLNLDCPNQSPLTSKSLGSGIYDVLIVPHPDGHEYPTMLTATDSGHVFCLEDRGDRLSVLHYQATGEHFKQLLGCGGGDILAVDHYNNLIPLKLGSPAEFIKLQKNLTEKLFTHPQVIPRFKIPLEIQLKKNDNTEQVACLARLATEHYILHSRDEYYNADVLIEWYTWLNQSKVAPEVNYWRWLELHLSLLERLESWLKLVCYCSVVQQWQPIPTNDVHHLEPLWIMYGPAEKDENNIPDEVWSKILQGSYLVEAFLRINGLNEKPEFQQRWTGITKRLAYIRSCFRPDKFAQRPLAILGSTQVNRHFKELQLIMEDNCHYHMVAIDCLGALHVIAVPKQTSLPWLITPLPNQRPRWQGRPITLLAGADLHGLLGRGGQQWIFVATDQGEMTLFEWKAQPQGTQIEQRWQGRYPIFARNALAINWKNMVGKAIILTGRNHTHHSVIAYLRFSRPQQGIICCDYEIAWQDGQRGETKKPVLSSTGDKVWAINQRRRSALLCWSIVFAGNKLVFRKEDQPWLLSDQPLHCLKLGGPQRKILVCGGHDGLVYALDASDGKLLWLVNCDKSLRRLCYIPHSINNEKNKGLWLLGSDHPNLVLVDDSGRFRAIYEKAGPVTALWHLSEQRLLLCNAQGRLLLMSGERPELAIPFNPNTSDLKLLASFYPRRSQNAISSDVLWRILQEQLGNKALGRDFLAMQVWFQSALTCLAENSSWLDSQENPFIQYLEQQSAQRIGLFLSDLRHLDDNNRPYPGLSPLLKKIWDSLPHRESDALIPQLIHHLLRTLEKQRHADHVEPDAQQLFEDINNFLWLSVDFPHEQKNREDHWPRLRASHLRDLRLSQAVYYWQQTVKEICVLHRLDQWCALLHDAWNLHDDAALKRRLHWVLKDAALPLVSGDERQWQDWLISIVAREYSKETTTVVLLPEPLKPLLQNVYSPWTEAQNNILEGLWETERHGFWREWLEKTYALLNKLARARTEPKRVIWQELSLINQIRGLFRDQGAMWFSFHNDYHLLALFWPVLSKAWDTAGKEHIDELLEQSAKDPSQYVDLSLLKVHWRSGNHAVVTLALTNRHPDVLRPELNNISFQDCVINDKKIPGHFDAKREATTLEVEIITPMPGVLQGKLILGLNSPHRGDIFDCSAMLNETRSIVAFNDSPGFHETWERLQTLLINQTENLQTGFLWWDGGHWPDDERARLKILVQEKFAQEKIVQEKPFIDVADQSAIHAIFKQPLDKPLFSPDIALGAVNDGALLEQVHGLLHTFEEVGVNRAALSAWLMYREAVPDSIKRALKTWLYSREHLDAVLRAVLGDDHFQRFCTALKSLEIRTMGAWLYGQPLYAENAAEVAHVALNERYVAAESLFGLDIWRALYIGEVTDRELADWLGIDGGRAGELLRIGIALDNLQRREQDGNAVEKVAKRFNLVLGGTLGISSSTRQLYYVEFTKKSEEISVLHGKLHPRCYLCFADGLALSEIAAMGAQHEEGLWLCVVSGDTPAGLPGETLGLSAQQLCGVLFADNQQQARNTLSQLAAVQMDYDPARVFRTAGGQSHEQSERHFSGRDNELRRLHAMLNEADLGKLSARLIIGTRRLGKTSLWDRFRHEVNTAQPQRLFIYMDLQDFTVGDNWSPVRIERQFIARLYRAAGWGEVRNDWSTSLRDDEQKSADVRDLLKARLAGYKLKAVLILDETRNWAEIDHSIRHRMLKMLRSLGDGGNCALVATSYPFHPDQRWGLNLAKYQANTGGYNFFQDDINLEPWPKLTVWKYLQDKLAGFGIVLPYQYRREMWILTRGIPWIVHQLGIELCDQKDSFAHSQRRVVLRSEWRSAYGQTLTKINLELRATVTAVVEECAKTYLPLRRSASKELQHEQLWWALSELAQSIPSEDSEKEWEDEQSFSFTTIADKLPDVDKSALRRVLNALTATQVLCAHPEKGSYDAPPYWFANNLFPSCLFLMRQQNQSQIERG